MSGEAVDVSALEATVREALALPYGRSRTSVAMSVEQMRSEEKRIGDALAALSSLVQAAKERDAYRVEADYGHDDYEDAEAILAQIAEARPNKTFDPWARNLCQDFLDRPSRSRSTISHIRERQVVAEFEAQDSRKAVLKYRKQASDVESRAKTAERTAEVLAGQVETLRETLARIDRASYLLKEVGNGGTDYPEETELAALVGEHPGWYSLAVRDFIHDCALAALAVSAGSDEGQEVAADG